MATSHQAPLTLEQLSAVVAGGGFAQCQDPVTQVHYHLIPFEPSTLDENYLREKLAEAQADIDQGNYAEWNVDELKRELRQRLTEQQSGQ